MDAHPHRQIEICPRSRTAFAAERQPDTEGGEQCPADAILVGPWSAEHRHKAVAGELRYGSVKAAHLGDRDFEKPVDEIAHAFGAEALGEPRRVDDVAKQHGYLLHFAGQRACRE